MSDDNKKAEFLPWAALNEFMVDSFRIDVVRRALLNMQKTGGKHRATIQRQIKKSAKVPGFRNPSKAPVQVQVRPAASVFAKDSDMVKAVLAVWAESQPELRQQAHDFLAARDWELLPAEADRGALPGWVFKWPVNDALHTLGNAFIDDGHPDVSLDDACLMICWVSGRLPVDMPKEGEEDAVAEDAVAEDAVAEDEESAQDEGA